MSDQSWNEFLDEVHENSRKYMAQNKECESCKVQDESATLKQGGADHYSDKEA